MNLWGESPNAIRFGAGMVIIDVELDKDHTLTMYCETDQLHLVNAALEKFIKEENYLNRKYA